MGVFSELKPKNNARRNPFDLSCFSTYNTKAGMILPLKFWPTLPNSEYELDLKALMRTQPLNTAAFAGFSINYDVVWTPNNDHYSSFNQFIAQRLNKQHTTQPDINQIPNFNLNNFLTALFNCAIWDFFVSQISREQFRYYAEHQEELQINRFVIYNIDIPNDSAVLSCFRSLDLLEYGNYYGLLKEVCGAIEYHLDSLTYEEPTDKDLPYIYKFAAWLHADGANTIPRIYHLHYCPRLSDLMDDINTYVTSGNSNAVCSKYLGKALSAMLPSNYYVDLWPIMCYNKAWWQFYRNEYYDEAFNVRVMASGYQNYQPFAYPYVSLFNCDDLSASITNNVADFELNTFGRLLFMFMVKPHQYKKDLFTGHMPSTQFGSVSVASSDSTPFALWYQDLDLTDKHKVGRNKSVSYSALYPLNSDGSDVGSNTVNSKFNSAKFSMDPTPMISVLELRRADSLQRFKERMLRAGNRTKDIFEAHGWEQPMSENAFEAEFFGSFDGRLDINVVAATSAYSDGTQKVDLGQLAANGVGVIGGNKIRFKSHDFGTLLIMAYITKDAVYDAYGVHKSHTLLEPWDFPYPELQNVSLSPISKDNLFAENNSNKVVLGYLPQNMAYKTANDLVHGEFFTCPWIKPQANLPRGNKIAAPIGVFSNMVTPRLDLADASTLPFYYIQPDCCDNIFVVQSSSLQDTDQFFCNVHFDLKAVQPLDVIGLPI